MVAHGLPTLYALESVQSSKLKGFVPLKSPRESVSDAQVGAVVAPQISKQNKQCTGFWVSYYLRVEMNPEKNIEEEYVLMSLASILLKRPFSWVSLLAPPLLHILGIRFLHLLLTCTALFFSSFFFPISLPHSSIQSSKQDQDQEGHYIATKDITGKSEENLEKTNEEDDDGAIPDDESLIELSLPSGHYLGHHYNSNKNHLCIHNKVQDFRLFDLLNEINDFIEEDNLIEIDISIGSIKYSRFEIKA
ncbi:hypothetical protein ISN44_As02g003490 [Arabidopsis suecica]|uniref:Uncharacterized protein n=1 Tax=Arabidopsis suecica TaxID=45249 RepID=A0A8T2GB48_ARASU|nr:hypothetical protein ISN44_As02g003490 [Arabidopsis suecica]